MENTVTELTLEDIIRIFKKRAGIFFLSLSIAIVVTLLYLFLATPIYEANVTIKINPSYESNVATLFTGTQVYTGRPDISTEIEIIKSRTVIERAVEIVGLHEFIRHSKREIDKDQLIQTIMKKWMKVTQVKNTRIVQLSIQHPDPNLATKLANAIAAAYNDRLKELTQTEYTSRRIFIEQQLPKVEERLAQEQEKLKQFKEKNQIFVLSEQAKNILSMLSNYDSEYNKISLELQEVSTKIKILRDTLSKVDQKIISSEVITSNPVIEQLRAKLANLQVELSGLLQTYPESDKRVVALRSQIAETEILMKKEVEKVVSSQTQVINPMYTQTLAELMDNEGRYQILQARLNAVNQLRKTYQQRVQTLPKIEQELVELERNLAIQSQIYTTLLQNLEESRIAEAGIAGNSQVVDSAIVPKTPVKPNKRLTLAIGGALGVFVGILLVFLIEYLDKTLKGEEEIKRILGDQVPILGRIPKHELESEGVGELVVLNSPTSPISEGFKLACTNIQFSKDVTPKILAMTSPGPKEGKTFIAANIAVSFAQSGFKTVLVDLDMRRPRLERALGLDTRKKLGFTNYLLQGLPLEEITVKFSDNLDIIPVGALPPNPTVLFTSSKFIDLMKSLSERYDKVVIDLPPILAAADALVVGKHTDGIILITRAGLTNRDSLKIAFENIKVSGNTLLGILINGIDKISSSYYYYYYYYY
ncbi:polysaccharide biosynthesis tyrosine autokinase, partial [Pseudothermotoga sp.]|uniref:GumC family protein n=1 Tax=Pseudothermotoga sp. TaxID=2033661 RepID=UPI0031F7183F